MAWIRVRDKSTRHEYDVQETDPRLAAGTVEHIKPVLYPPSPIARPPKHHIKPAGRPARQETPASSDVGDTGTHKE